MKSLIYSKSKFLILAFFCFYFLIITTLNSQTFDIVKFQFSDTTIVDAQLVNLENSIMLIYVKNNNIFSSKSENFGQNWSEPILIKSISSLSSIKFSALRTNTGRLIIVFLQGSNIKMIYSDDSGNSWSNELIVGTYLSISEIMVTQIQDNVLWLTFIKGSNLYYIISNDNGNTWGNATVFLSNVNAKSFSIKSTGDNKLIAVFQKSSSGNQDILISYSYDNGNNWSTPIYVLNSELNEEKPRLFLDTQGFIGLIYQVQKPLPVYGIYQYDIHYILSSDGGTTWSPSFQFTRYVDDDILLGAEQIQNEIMISFFTTRFSGLRKKDLATGFLNLSHDSFPPPVIYNVLFSNIDLAKSTLSIKVFTYDDNGIQEVKVEVPNMGIFYLYDDGLHNDSLAGDYIFGNSIKYRFVNAITINNIKIPIRNNGVIADDRFSLNLTIIVRDIDNKSNFVEKQLTFNEGAFFEGNSILFSSGFMLSGYSNDTMWANGVATSSRILDYQSGPVGSNPNDPKNKLYFIKKDDPPFGDSWQNWRDAVSSGAYFYDGDNDGIYNPIDKNGNGRWDPNEDMPDILGDETAWCVYNDGISANNRRFSDVTPKGIEIRQTVFASNKTGFENTILVRYSILNKGTISSVLDSVYFSIWADADIGDYNDDLAGCDTLLQSGYAYNQGSDSYYGFNPPAFFITLLQGPKKFTGNYSDTAYNNRGMLLGKQVFVGYKNLRPSSFMHYYQSQPVDLSDPQSRFEARNYILALTKSGNLINPCNWFYGNVVGGVICNSINPRYLYSGDPVLNFGWINSFAGDQRIMLNTGPFQLKINEPVDLIVSYTVGRGNDDMNSITIAREYVNSVINEYNRNFGTITSVENDQYVNNRLEFKLEQNFPNPFNSSTVIRWHSAERGRMSLAIYDILGRHLATLVDEERNPGSYYETLDANKYNLSSGVYFYTLTINSHKATKKLLLIK